MDISAPGNVIMSTYPMAECASTTTPGDTGCYAWQHGHLDGRHRMSQVPRRSCGREATSPATVRWWTFFSNSADPVGVANVRLDSWTIHGGLNLHDALSYGLTNLPPHAHAGPIRRSRTTTETATELVTLDGTASSDSDGSIVSYEWREGGTSIGVGATAAVWLSARCPHA